MDETRRAPEGIAQVLEQPASLEAAAPSAHRAEGRTTALERALVRRVLAGVGDPPLRVVLWDGQEVGSEGRTPAARVVIRDRPTLLKLFFNPNLRFGEAYSDGRIEVEGDLLALLEAVSRATLPHARPTVVRSALRRLLRRPRRLALAYSRRNIHQHYDLGNEFYRLWLDREMVYTCAYYPRPEATLEEAQVAKMDHVARKLRLRPGQSVIEAGCGWGALAVHLARSYGVRVRAFNISREQVSYARQRAAAEGLDGQVEFILDDYRNIAGRCDAFVSVGMLEHVGPEHYRELGAVIDRCLAPAGRGLIHTIGRNVPSHLNPWIARYIFPGGYPPTLREMTAIFEPFAFSVLDVENLRLHYARTLEAWLGRFEAGRDHVQRMFDARFVRMWRLYLTGSMAAFTTGWMQLFQVVFARPTDNEVPPTRAYLYHD